MSEPTIGIDLGTTWSAVATVEGTPRIIPNREGGRLTPSMVGFTPAGERLVGERARVLAESMPENVASAAKRFLGLRWTPDVAAAAREVVPYPVLAGPHGDCRIKVAGRTVPPTQVSAMILGELKLDAEAYFGRPVTRAVITVPANFDDGQRNATKEAARIAGLEVLRLLNEPTSAAVAYGLGRNFQGRALVFDLGGGTFDVSILDIQNGVFEVRATGGDPHLGGEDFDNRIVQWLIAQVPQNVRESVARDRLSLQRLKIAAERAKRELSVQQEAYLTVQGVGDNTAESPKLFDLETALTRDFFEVLSRPLSERCLAVCQQVMAEARLQPSELDAVLLVGGMTRVPLVRALVTDFFGKSPAPGVNPDEVVAVGAAIHAHEMFEQAGRALLIDVTAHSLGVGVLGGKVRRLISKNTTIPHTAKETFLPGQAGQKQARIPIYQGESEYADENHKLGELVLRDLEVADRAQVPIEVSFELATDGTLSVRAANLSSGAAEDLRIEARTALNAAEEGKLAEEQQAYAVRRAPETVQTARQNFERLLERSERLARLLEMGAEENPSGEAQATVATIQALIDQGRAALRVGSPEQMVEVRSRLAPLLR